MSFRNPFQRLHTSKKSAISRTEEREYEREYKKCEQLDEHSRKIYKDMRKCVEAQTAQGKLEVKASSNLLNGPLSRDDPEMKKVAETWNQATHRLERHMNELNATSLKTVSEPMKKFCTLYPGLQSASKKRESSLQEYSKWQTKHDKYNERGRTGPNRVKLEQSKKSLATAKADFEGQNKALMADMSKLYEGRAGYIEPSFQALIKSQIKYYTEAHKQYTELSAELDEEKMDMPAKEFEQNIAKKIAGIKALTITMDK